MIEPASATPVIIEDNVLVGANAVIIEGVHVGEGAVVAAGAVVIEDVPPHTVVAGTPARVIKQKDEKATQKTALFLLFDHCNQHRQEKQYGICFRTVLFVKGAM